MYLYSAQSAEADILAVETRAFERRWCDNYGTKPYCDGESTAFWLWIRASFSMFSNKTLNFSINGNLTANTKITTISGGGCLKINIQIVGDGSCTSAIHHGGGIRGFGTLCRWL